MIQHDHPTTTAAKLEILANARFVMLRIGGHTKRAIFIRPAVQKCVLFHILAFEGKPISGRSLQDRSGVSHGNVCQILNALLEKKIITATPVTPRTRQGLRVFTLNWLRLQNMATSTPLVMPSGAAGAERKHTLERLRATNTLKGPPQWTNRAPESSPSTPQSAARATA